jgi:hypothetical protein
VKPPLDAPIPSPPIKTCRHSSPPIDWAGPNKKVCRQPPPRRHPIGAHLTPRHYLPASSPAPAPGRHHSPHSAVGTSLLLGGRPPAKRGEPRERRVACSLLRPHVPWPLRFLLPVPVPIPTPSEPAAACRSGGEERRADAMQQHEPWRSGAEPAGAGAGPAPTTVDEASMERSKSFVKALQVRRAPLRSDPILIFTNPFLSLDRIGVSKIRVFPGALIAAPRSLQFGAYHRCP